MESFHIQESADNQCSQSYIFSPDDLADIPHPDDISEREGNSPMEDSIELPLPPGTSSDDFPPPFQYKQPTKSSSDKLPPLTQNESLANSDPVLMPDSFNILPLNDTSQQKTELGSDEFVQKPMEIVDDSKYSPSKADSDEENQDFTAAKPKVLGKEQAKKRLMAFSLSKQPTNSIKKQNKAVTPAKNKEKPPNPNKGTNVQEQFRATISAIEEEKKKMFQNLPNYLLQEMTDLGKSHSLSSPSGKSRDSKTKRSSHRSRSRSNSRNKSKRRRRSRSKRRSRSASKSRSRRSRSASKSRSRRRSSSRSRRNRSHSKRPREEKNHKSNEKISQDNQPAPKKKQAEDWSSYKASGSNENNSKSQPEESKPRHSRRSRSPASRNDFKPIFNYLTKGNNSMSPLLARPADSSSSAAVTFSEKNIKFTRTKPIICWAENPSHATEFYMSKEMLLENCDQSTTPLLLAIIENKTTTEKQFEPRPMKNRPWYPRQNYLSVSNESDSAEPFEKCSEGDAASQSETGDHKKDIASIKEDAKRRRASLERKISLVNDSYMSDEEDQVKEMMLGEVKVQLDLDKNRVKVRSKWDSDYEGENSEKESGVRKPESKRVKTEQSTDVQDKLAESFELEKPSGPSEKKIAGMSSSTGVPPVESPSVKPTESGNLVSEYEEFLKMVSVDSSDVLDTKVEKSSEPKVEKQKGKNANKTGDDSRKSPKVGLTDWDQESDREDKTRKEHYGNTDEFLIAKSEKVKKEGKRKKKVEKKSEKGKEGKAKISKKGKKVKKKKYEESRSEDSSSDSDESDSSESDSNDSDSARKKKKKKYSKNKKKYREESSSESESDSDESRTKKKKWKQKKSGKKKTESSESEGQNAMLKQLDYKKQLIMKKIEEMDSVGEKVTKKKQKEGRVKKKEADSHDDTDLEKYIKTGKKKKSEVKVEKEKKKLKNGSKKGKLLGKGKKLKKSKSSSESESETSEEDSARKKKWKKSDKKKRDTSEESESDSDEKGRKSNKSKTAGKSYKKSKKARKDSSSSESGSEDSSKTKKKDRNKKEEEKNNEGKVTEGTELNMGDNLMKGAEGKPWERKKAWKKGEVDRKKKKKKDEDDWETSSDESEKETKGRESSWDEEVLPREAKTHLTEEDISKTETKTKTDKKPVNENSQADLMDPLSSGTLKTSLSVFSFNENSFCSFGQELSRDFFLTDYTHSNSGQLTECSKATSGLESRPFQSVSKDAEVKKGGHSELYSPGHSDSEISDGEANKPENPSNRAEVYDPLNCESDGSVENNKVELSSIPLPCVSDILLPGETRSFENLEGVLPPYSENSVLKDLSHNDKTETKPGVTTPPLKVNFTPTDFAPSPVTEDKTTPSKRQVMSVKGTPKLISKAAAVFQDESDEENIEPAKKVAESTEGKSGGENRSKDGDQTSREEKSKSEGSKRRHESRDRSRERSSERNTRRRRSRSRERRSSGKSKKSGSPSGGKNKTQDSAKREIRSDSFEIEPLKSCMDSDDLDLVQPIPVLTGLESSTDAPWSRSIIPGCEFSQGTDNLIDNAEAFDIYPSEESTYRNKLYESKEKSKKERRKSRSKSYSPKRKIRSKSPEKRKSPRSRSPRKKSPSPKRRDKSPFSPRRRSPKRKSPSRRYKSSRSPDKRRKSRSRSPRKRRTTPSRRSRSISPRKYRSPKHADDSPRRRDSSATTFSPRERFSPKKDSTYSQQYPLQNRIPVIGASADDPDRELSPSGGFSRHMGEPSTHESDMYNSFYEGEYTDEFGMSSYPEKVTGNNLITVKNHDLEKTSSSERLTLDQRIELELGVQMSGGSQPQSEQYQVCPQFQDGTYFQNSCNCDSGNVGGDSFYQNQNISDFNGQYFNGHQQQSGYRAFQQYPNSQPVQNSVLQVGNIVEVVPTPQHPPHSQLSSKPTPQIMQVGNVLQVVPAQKSVPPGSQPYSDDPSTVKTQKATAVVAPSSVVPTPNPEAVLSPLIKAIQMEREKRRKEKEKRKAEREARRKARQLRREAKLMLVNEKLKKSVQNEGLMLGQEVEDDELLDGLDVPSPPIPVEIITVSSPNALPPAGKGILITAGFMPKPPSEKKEVKFADGVCPGEGTSTSGGEEIASPPPKPKLPKEKRFKKRKTKVKKKVKVQIIRQIIQEEDDDDDDLSPPPPPPGDPPPVFFARFPFAGEAQFPVYQTQTTTTTTLTTVQYPNQSFE